MVRIFIEDCLKYVPNKFELVILASHRLEALRAGAVPLVDTRPGDSLGEICLMEIAQGALDIDQLRQDLVVSYCETSVESDLDREMEVEEEVFDAIGRISEGEGGVSVEELVLGKAK